MPEAPAGSGLQYMHAMKCTSGVYDILPRRGSGGVGGRFGSGGPGRRFGDGGSGRLGICACLIADDDLSRSIMFEAEMLFIINTDFVPVPSLHQEHHPHCHQYALVLLASSQSLSSRSARKGQRPHVDKSRRRATSITPLSLIANTRDV